MLIMQNNLIIHYILNIIVVHQLPFEHHNHLHQIQRDFIYDNSNFFFFFYLYLNK
jgi:hypothetical protein